jgi:hypothetical protein
VGHTGWRLLTDTNSAVEQVAPGFEAKRFKGQDVVGADVASLLDEEQFVVGLAGRKETDTAAIPRNTRLGPLGQV